MRRLFNEAGVDKECWGKESPAHDLFSSPPLSNGTREDLSEKNEAASLLFFFFTGRSAADTIRVREVTQPPFFRCTPGQCYFLELERDNGRGGGQVTGDGE